MSEGMSPAERFLRSQQAAYTKWAACADRAEATAKARRAAMDRFDHQVDPNRVLAPEVRARRAEFARKAYFAGLARQSAKARRLRRNADALDAEVASSDQHPDELGLAGAENPQPGLEGGES